MLNSSIVSYRIVRLKEPPDVEFRSNRVSQMPPRHSPAICLFHFQVLGNVF